MLWTAKDPPAGYEIPCLVFDATGAERGVDVIEADTETGRVVRLLRDVLGGVQLTEDGMALATAEEYLPAPLRIVHWGGK